MRGFRPPAPPERSERGRSLEKAAGSVWGRVRRGARRRCWERAGEAGVGTIGTRQLQPPHFAAH